jgi:hypothetical protein
MQQRLRQQAPLKCQQSSTRQHGTMTQKTDIFKFSYIIFIYISIIYVVGNRYNGMTAEQEQKEIQNQKSGVMIYQLFRSSYHLIKPKSVSINGSVLSLLFKTTFKIFNKTHNVLRSRYATSTCCKLNVHKRKLQYTGRITYTEKCHIFTHKLLCAVA